MSALVGGILSVDSLAGLDKPNALANAWFPGLKGAEAMAKSLFGAQTLFLRCQERRFCAK